MKTQAMIGIDPGITGAIALLLHSDKHPRPRVIEARMMPVQAKKSGRNEVDATGIALLLDELGGIALNLGAHPEHTRCIIERVTAMPKQGVASQFSLGDSFGAVRGAAAASFGRIEYVRGATWKTSMKLGKEKAYALAVALKLYPELRAQLTTRKADNIGLAEAALLAAYGFQMQW